MDLSPTSKISLEQGGDPCLHVASAISLLRHPHRIWRAVMPFIIPFAAPMHLALYPTVIQASAQKEGEAQAWLKWQETSI